MESIHPLQTQSGGGVLMRKPFKRHKSEYEQAKADYSGVIPPDELNDILERSLEQYPKNGVEFDLLVDMKVMKRINDSIKRLYDGNPR